MPQILADLETPIAVVDLDRLARNLDRAASYATAHGLSLRPHTKTHKSPVIARQQLDRGAVGVTCATTHEAEVMSEVCDDILVAYPPVGAARARRIAGLPKHARVTVSLDSMVALNAIAAAALENRREVGVYVELDLGMHRVGLSSLDAAIALAREAASRPHLRFDGIAFYPGHVRQAVARQTESLTTLDAALCAAVESFERAGLRPPVVSGGSTPTLWRTHELRAVTEFRPGTYVYNDRTTASIEACVWNECALTVLATVVSTAVPGQAVIDAGTKALGREPIRGTDGEGFGALLDRPEVLVKSMSEEHGILDLSMTNWRPDIGQQVRVVPNHVCIVVHLNDVIVGARGDVVETTWPVAARGRAIDL